MQLTKQTDYAFRVLMYLGSLPADTLANIQQIGEFHDISTHHLAKVVVKLAKLGYIKAYRGKGGGLALAKDPAHIPLDEVVKAFETTMNPVSCDKPSCCISADCQLKDILFDAMQQFLQTLGKHTLADILHQTDKQVDEQQVVKIS